MKSAFRFLDLIASPILINNFYCLVLELLTRSEVFKDLVDLFAKSGFDFALFRLTKVHSNCDQPILSIVLSVLISGAFLACIRFLDEAVDFFHVWSPILCLLGRRG